ncbi:hypothetical protein [Aquabacterium sp.]|uniref:hypothetical protein n=1 Tax=Aquabacterium sp. TaxID=1872578 RepID=UPI0035B3C178
MKRLIKLSAVAAGWLLGSMAAQAVTVTSADLQSFADGSTSNVTVNGVHFNAVGGKLDAKSVAGYLGIGVTGKAADKTAGEINIGESIRASWGAPETLSSFSVAFLYNGPEFGDVNEVAKVALTGANGIYGKLTAVSDTQAKWQLFSASNVALGAASFVNAVSPADASGAGVWTVVNPFANYVGTGVKFSALKGACGVGDCTDQSDYAFFSLTTAAVPEPGSFSMLVVGLLAVSGLVLYRRPRD